MNKLNWISRLKKGLSKSSSTISEGIHNILTKKRLDASTLQSLEDLLIEADLGLDLSISIIEKLKSEKFEKNISVEEIKIFLSKEIQQKLNPISLPLEINQSAKPHVILVVGVNGSGKTTTIAKLSNKFVKQGYKVVFGAADTFRAAAAEQLKVWSDRLGIEIIGIKGEKDSSGVAYDSLIRAQQQKADILIIDTAGRLQNKSGLMDELAKINRVLKKIDPTSPHSILLTLDATSGQNAIHQAEIFQKVSNVTGLIITKLDGTARAGFLVSIADKLNIPVHAIGVGEDIDDLNDFNSSDFADIMVGLDKNRSD
ncbi:signal recognition particle-docking protein FtsY [Hyphomicrobiales bacterium]|nr:signal recognition particle-docking protein FtsY [Hyphomicrobiales bacterium]MDB4831469.1 signal recognition particle-docking protein FtsY [Hyphomicrobiales bacterium]MDC0139346.1 signal recognition particle-docking protein FtsY [Hyphomicrobiales bacterium]MDC3272894.1 signal recognition particle-docking protein FtsY [Hyphomicrobiales bacterium]